MFDKFFNHIKNTCSQREKPTHYFIINWTIETSVSEVRYTFLFLNNLSMKLVKFWLCLIYLQIFPPPLFSYFPFSTYSPFFFLIVFSFSFSYVSHTSFFFFAPFTARKTADAYSLWCNACQSTLTMTYTFLTFRVLSVKYSLLGYSSLLLCHA